MVAEVRTRPADAQLEGRRIDPGGAARWCTMTASTAGSAGGVARDADLPVLGNAAIAARLGAIVGQKEDRHHIGEPGFVQPQRSMSCIGG